MTISGTPAQISLQVFADLVSSLTLNNVLSETAYSQIIQFTNGTGANQIQNVYSARRTLTASSTENLDLAGTLTDAFGATITFTKIKAMIFFAAAANTNDVLVGGAASNGFATWVNDPTDIVKVKPGGLFVLVAPDANGLAVTASTGDLLKVANSSSGTSVTYDVIILGV